MSAWWTRRAAIEPKLVAHEAAIARYDHLLARGGTRRAIQGPLIAAGAFMLTDDASGFGVADNVALPFVAIGVVGTALLTAARRREVS